MNLRKRGYLGSPARRPVRPIRRRPPEQLPKAAPLPAPDDRPPPPDLFPPAEPGDHVIRLRGPWEVTAGGENASKLRWPIDAAGLRSRLRGGEPARLRRAFGRPAEPTPEGERWLLEVAAVWPVASVRFNGEPLPILTENQGITRWDVTARLRPRNELLIQLTPADGEAASVFDARLVIRPTAAG